MSTTKKKSKFSFGKLLLIAFLILFGLHIVSGGESTEDILELFSSSSQTDTTRPVTPQYTKPQSSGSQSTTPQQTDPPETVPPETVWLPSVPAHLQNHVYLDKRNSGYCEYLTGKVVVTVIFVSDPDGSWTEEAINTAKTDLQAAVSRITSDAAGYGAQVDLSLQYKTASTSVKIVDGNTVDWAESALSSAGLPERRKISLYLEDLYGADSAPVVFIANHGGRANANYISGNEYAVLYEDVHPFYHELSHIFGAKDFYFPQDVKKLSETYLPNSIMVDSENGVMEDLTAYLIGWTDTLSSNALEFLEKTAYLTPEYLAAEKEKDSYTGYVTEFFNGDGTYTGYLVRGVRHGQGKYTSNEGAVWEGTFVHGSLDGYGTYISPDGDRYEGNWIDGKRQGQGTYTWAEGGKHVGNFEDGVIQGYGVRYYRDGGRYEGNWVNNNRHGQGILYYADGDVYNGQWSEGSFSGQGTYTWTDGSKYVGNFVSGKRSGYGVYYFSGGGRYEGNWASGERNGQGTMYYANGSVYTGQWSNSQRKGQGKYTYADGNYYEGTWSNDTWNGQGTFRWVSGDKYTGNFVDGYRHGYGVYYYSNGARYEGNWVTGERHGQGTMYYADGSTRSGMWDNGNFVG